MVNLEDLFKDKTVKTKAKTEILSSWIVDKKLSIKELLEFAEGAKDPVKATCIEGLEFATKQDPAIATKEVFQFVTDALKDKAPRVKWESAKVIGNTASLFAEELDKPIANLLVNTTHEGTVVRWSAAFALGEILKLNTRHNKKLLPTIESIISKEEQNSIKKIFLDSIKKMAK
ncbi:HEAT repeat domain-containing protein [Flavitalea sp.]|nr:HEAT repeat domain-containing protein [Flavitalea sp.]